MLDKKLCGSGSKYANLNMLFVIKEQRELGIGIKLFISAYEAAIKLGPNKLFVSAYPEKDTIEFCKKQVL